MGGPPPLQLFIVLILFKGCLAADVQVRASPSVIVANPGETITAVCTAYRDGRVVPKLESCRFRVNGTTYSLKPEKAAYMGISYYGRGLDNGECGIQIKNIANPNNENITCFLELADIPSDSEGHVQIIVALPPKKINMTINGESANKVRVFKAGEQITATCGISQSRPISNVTWRLGNVTLAENLQVPVESCVDSQDICSIEQKLTFTVKESDDKKILSCAGDHYALKRSQLLAKFKITVNYPPKPSTKPIEKFALVIGQPARISIVIDANPKPTVSWKVGEDIIYETSTIQHYRVDPTILNKETNLWESSLVLETLTKIDTEKSITVHAHNELGEADYDVMLSTSLEPTVLAMDPTKVFLIVILIIIVLLLIAGGLYSRSRGILCCAARDNTGHVGESSDTESTDHTANKPKLKFISVFKKKNDKVAADNEILQTLETQPTHSDQKSSAENLVYAELDLGSHSPGPTVVVRGDDDKTEYAEIIHTQPPPK